MREKEVIKKAKASKEESFKTFYTELLTSIKINVHPIHERDDNIWNDNNKLPTDREGLVREARESYKSIDDYKCRGMPYYARFALVLAKLKFIYFIKCCDCTVISPEPDMFKI